MELPFSNPVGVEFGVGFCSGCEYLYPLVSVPYLPRVRRGLLSVRVVSLGTVALLWEVTRLLGNPRLK